MDTHSNPNHVDQDSALVAFWNETLAPEFVRYGHIMEDGLSRHSNLVMPLLDVRPGDNALDVDCGFGNTAMALVGRLGAGGKVLGVDSCEALLDIACNRPEGMLLR